MNLLVTGGAGFIGSHLIRRVINEHVVRRVVNLDALTYAGHLENTEDFRNHPKYKFIQVDIREGKPVFETLQREKITHVIHLAAESHVDRSLTTPDVFVHTNILGTTHLLDACRILWDPRGRHRFLHVSTDEVFGSTNKGFFVEESPYCPSSPYSASKAGSDLIVRSYHTTYGLPALLTHSSNNYGPYQFPEKLIPVIIQSVLHRRPIPIYGDGLNVRDWMFVTDHAEALWTVLNHGKLGQSYNIGGGCEIANIHLAEQVCDCMDELAPQLGGKSRKLIKFVKDRPGHDRRYAVSIAKIKKELGWTPKVGFSEGIFRTVRWYLDHQDWMRRVLP